MPIADVSQTLQVLSDKQRLLVFSSIDGSLVDEAAPKYAQYTRITPLLLPNLTPGGPSLVVKAQLMEARSVNGLARLTVWSQPRVSSAQEQALEQWLPTVVESDGTESLAVECQNVLAIDEASGGEMVSVLTVGMDGTWNGSGASLSVLRSFSGAGRNDGAFFGGQRYGYVASDVSEQDGPQTTGARLLRIDLQATPPAYAGVVETPATRLGTMSEYDKLLRFHGGDILTAIRSDEAFDVIGSVTLPGLGSAMPLSFRSPHLIVGNQVVAFSTGAPPTVGSTQDHLLWGLDCAVGSGQLAGARQMDGAPLVYTMDISDPNAPTVLHDEIVPGWDTTPAGENAVASVGRATCLPSAGLMAIPLSIDNDVQNEEGTGWSPNDKQTGFALYDPERETVIGQWVEPTDHYAASEREIREANGRLVTVSTNGIMVVEREGLETVAWMAFPQ